jgi:hypothetical protein
MKHTALSVTFIYREYKNSSPGSRGATWNWVLDVHRRNGNSQTIDAYRVGDDSEDVFVVANPPGRPPSETLTPNGHTGSPRLNKSVLDGWMFHIDYTYSQTGNHTNTTTASWGGHFMKPNRQINAQGYFPYDARMPSTSTGR